MLQFRKTKTHKILLLVCVYSYIILAPSVSMTFSLIIPYCVSLFFFKDCQKMHKTRC